MGARAEAAVKLQPRSPGSSDTVTNGDYVMLGTWNSAPLLWETVELEKDGNKQQLWLASRYVKSMMFDAEGTSQGWADSDIKDWLNDDFKNSSGLSAYSSNGLLQLYEKFFDGPFTYYSGGQRTAIEADAEIFLLAVEEVNYIYTGDVNTQYDDPDGMTKRMAYVFGSGEFAGAWTRSATPGDEPNPAFVVGDGGDLCTQDQYAGNFGVRPALSLNLDSVIFKSKSSDVYASGSADPGGYRTERTSVCTKSSPT